MGAEVRNFTILCTVTMLILLLVASALGCESLGARQYNHRGIALADEGQYEKAISEFGKAIALDPSFSAAYYNRGLVYQTKGEVAKAISDFEKCLELSNQPRVTERAQEKLDYLRE